MKDQLPYQSLSTIVKELCMGMYNDSKKYYANWMIHAKWIYKELFLKSLFRPKSKYVKVDRSTNPYSIVLPLDMVRFINLSDEDYDGSMRSFVFDETINDVELPKGDVCQSCNESDDYGQCVNNIVPITKSVVINGEPYTETIWKKLCPNGDMQEVRSVPTYDAEAEEVVMVEVRRHLCNLELKTCGCVKKTPRNKELVTCQCGPLTTSTQVCMAHASISKVGTRKGRIKIRAGRIWLAGNVPDWLILTYQTNGNCGEDEIMVEEVAVPAMLFGMKWRASALADTVPPGKVDYNRMQYDREIENLDMFNNPIRVEEFMNVQMIIPKWGSEVDQRDMKSCWLSCDDILPWPDRGGTTVEKLENLLDKYRDEVVVVSKYVIEDGKKVYVQVLPAVAMLIMHDLGHNPNVATVLLDGGAVIEGIISYPADNISVLIKFATPVAVKIYLV